MGKKKPDQVDLYDDLKIFSPEQKEIDQGKKNHLIKELNNFNEWLINGGITKEKFDIESIIIEPFSDEDWTMKVHTDNEKKQIVSFNPNIIRLCNFEYWEMVILHEYFHLVVQKVPNKEDALKIKDTFGSDFMSLIDIEADFYVASYLKENNKITAEEYWKLCYTGSSVFSDKWIRTKKFERFLGSLLSINKMFLSTSPTFDLYLPTISPIYTEESIMILVIKREHIAFEEIFAEFDDFKKLKNIYKNSKSVSFEEYYEILNSFTKKALNI
jgi:hypothetical protein